ncbi:hypothetical protein RI054_13g64840 [Pseudoscourfieldia marina]
MAMRLVPGNTSSALSLSFWFGLCGVRPLGVSAALSSPPQRSFSGSSSSGASSSDKYYDSQSGRWVSAPGSRGIRVHAIAPLTFAEKFASPERRAAALAAVLAARPTSVEIWAEACTCPHVRTIVAAAKQEQPDFDTVIVQRVANAAALETAVTQGKDVVDELSVAIPCFPPDSPAMQGNAEALGQMLRTAAVSLISQSPLPVRGSVLGAFEPSCHADAATAAAAFADAGCETIVMSESRPASEHVSAPPAADEDDVRACLEDVCGMDFEGELMSERVVVAASTIDAFTMAQSVLGITQIAVGGDAVAPEEALKAAQSEEKIKECVDVVQRLMDAQHIVNQL